MDEKQEQLKQERKLRTIDAQKEKRKKQEGRRVSDEAYNPCSKESGLSLKCLNDNDYDRDKCQLYFKNYTNCMNFWRRVMHDRKGRGIEPVLPPPEQRDQLKEEYFVKWSR